MGSDTGSDVACEKRPHKVAKQFPGIGEISVSVLSSNYEDSDFLGVSDSDNKGREDVSDVEKNPADVCKRSVQHEEDSDAASHDVTVSESEWTDSAQDLESDASNCATKRKRYACTYEGCQLTFIRPWRLSAHLDHHLGKRPFKCTVSGCGKDYSNNSHLRRHMTRSHPANLAPSVSQLKCPRSGCLMQLANLTSLKKHIERRHSSKSPRFSCSQCDAAFHKHFQLSDHVHLHHSESPSSVAPRYNCPVCRRGFHERWLFKKHERMHRRDYKCQHAGCSVEFVTWSALRKHVKQEHPTNCLSESEHSSSSQSSTTPSSVIGTPRRQEWPCSVCSREFTNKAQLRLHQETHAAPEQRPKHACQHPGCNKEYTQQRNLTAHIARCHGDKRFPCQQEGCGARLATKQKLAEHIEKLHNCKKPQEKKAAKKPAKCRKDSNKPKRSMVSKLLGIVLPIEQEKMLINSEQQSPVIAEEIASNCIVDPVKE